MPEPTSNVVQFASARRRRQPIATPVHPAPDASLSLIPDAPVFPAMELFDPAPTKPRGRAKAPSSRPRSNPKLPQTPERQRALEIAQTYKARQPLCNKTKVADTIETAIGIGNWTDAEIVAAVERLAGSKYGVTPDSLRIELGTAPQHERQVDPVIHQAVDAALEHLGRLDSETMTGTEQTLAAALRSVCVAVMHQAATQ